jgi:hypothetical protein
MLNKFKKFLNEKPLTLLSYILFICGVVCIPFSFFIMLTHYPTGTQDALVIQNLAIFIGIWVIALFSAAIFFKNKD